MSRILILGDDPAGKSIIRIAGAICRVVPERAPGERGFCARPAYSTGERFRG